VPGERPISNQPMPLPKSDDYVTAMIDAVQARHAVRLLDARSIPRARAQRCGLSSVLRTGRGVGRKGDRDGEAAYGSREDVEAGSVGFGDVGNDGQAETETIRGGRPIRGAALEGLEQSTDLICCYQGSGVGHGERRFGGAGCELDLDTPACGVVTDGVVDEVRHQPVEEPGVPGHRGIVESGVEPVALWPPQTARGRSGRRSQHP
jgi:hypothetical protein